MGLWQAHQQKINLNKRSQHHIKKKKTFTGRSIFRGADGQCLESLLVTWRFGSWGYRSCWGKLVVASWWLVVGGWLGWFWFGFGWVGFGFDWLFDWSIGCLVWFGLDFDWLTECWFWFSCIFWFWKGLIIIISWFIVYLYVCLLDLSIGWLLVARDDCYTTLDSWIKIVDTVLLPHRNHQQTPGIILLHLSESTQKESFRNGKTQQFGHLHIMSASSCSSSSTNSIQTLLFFKSESLNTGSQHTSYWPLCNRYNNKSTKIFLNVLKSHTCFFPWFRGNLW